MPAGLYPGPDHLYQLHYGTGQGHMDEMMLISNRLYITELMGSSVSLTTGDYSRGASGFWIENGKITCQQPKPQLPAI